MKAQRTLASRVKRNVEKKDVNLCNDNINSSGNGVYGDAGEVKEEREEK